MRALEILVETDFTPLLNTTDDDEYNKVQGQRLAEYIRKNCSGWNNERGGTVFYRGTKRPKEIENYQAFVRSPRDDRRPRDTDALSHAIFNEGLKEANSIANRNNSLFCTASSSTANGFAATYHQIWVVFPFDGYHYAFAENVSDWTTTWGSDLVDWAGRIGEDRGNSEDVENFFLAHPTTLDGAPDAVVEAAEILIDTIADTVTVDDDLQHAGMSDTEVMVTGSKVLHVSVNFYNDWVASHLN